MLKKLIIFAVVFLATASSAFAYSHRSCYDTPLRFRGATGTIGAWSGSFPAGAWRTGAQDAINKFNTHPGNYRMDMNIDTFHVSIANGESEMWFSRDDLWLAGAPAIAYYQDICIWFFGITDGYYVNEVDVLYDRAEPYTLSENKRDLWFYGGGRRPFKNVVLHEVGHGMGFSHNNYNYNIMGEDFTHLHVNGSRARAYLGEDISRGIVAHYGPKANWEDVSVSHWRYLSRAGEYSMHRKTELIGAGGELPTINIGSGEDPYVVNPGQWMFFRFTYENTGLTCHRVPVGFYLSSNDTISVFDRRISGVAFTVCPGAPDTRTFFVRLPADLPRSSPMWFGTVIDETGSVRGDRNRSNNATYIPIWVN